MSAQQVTKNLGFVLSLLFLLFCEAQSVDGPSLVDVVYSPRSEIDGEYITTQLAPQYLNGSVNLELFLWPYGEVQIISDENGTFYCHGAETVCEISLIHYCSGYSIPKEQFVTFLQCYFQSEHFPVDLLAASEQCHSENVWEVVKACTVNSESFDSFANDVRVMQDFRPATEKSLRVTLNTQYSHLAAIDLEKALCRVNATNIWSCASTIQYKEPSVQVFYTLGAIFDLREYQALLDTTSRTDILPNPNELAKCQSANSDVEKCTNYYFYWCIYELYTTAKQLDLLKCIFSPGQKQPFGSEDCLSENDVNAILQCVKQIAISGLPPLLRDFQSKLNQEVAVLEQRSLEVLINGRSNVKANIGLLEEVCYNYLHVDNETLGCAVSRPKVQVYYEPTESMFSSKFTHFIPLGRFAPFESIADFEFIPYPNNVTYSDGNYICPETDNGLCMATWIHGCILKMHYTNLQDQFRFLSFFICTSQKVEADPMKQAEECVKEVYEEDYGLHFWQSLVDCAETDNNVKEELHSKTELIELKMMPEIVINGKVKTIEVGHILLHYLCHQATPIKPRVCFEIDDTPTSVLRKRIHITIFLNGDDERQSAREFMLTQVKPLLESGLSTRSPALHLRDLIKWSFVPWGDSTYNNTSGEMSCAFNSSYNLTTPLSRDCLINSIFTCAGRVHSTQDAYRLGVRDNRLRVVSFIVCFYETLHWQSTPLKAAKECIGKLSTLETAYPQLEQCAVQNSTKTVFLLQMKRQTENNYPPLTVFPVVKINQQMPQVVNNLAQHLCLIFDNVFESLRPSECIKVQEETTTEGSNDKPPNGKAEKTAIGVFAFYFLLTLAIINLTFNFLN